MFITKPETPNPKPAFTATPKSAIPLVLAQLITKNKTILHICVNDREMERLVQALAFFAPEAEILQFPAWDTMPYDRASPSSAIMAERMRVLSLLSSPRLRGELEGGVPQHEKFSLVDGHPHPNPLPQAGEGIILLTTVNAVTQKLPPQNVLRNITLTLASGQNFPRDALVEVLLKQGYHRSGKAMEPGEFALRGGILDLVAPGMTQGLRLDFFGDTIETIKPYDPFTQITQGSLPSVSLYPVSEVLLNDETLTRFRERYRDMFGAVTKDDPLYETLSQGTHYPGMEHWLPLFYENTATLFDYIPESQVTFDTEAAAALEERWESIRDYYDARKNADTKKNSFASGAVYHPLPPEEMFLLQAGWEVTLQQREHVVFNNFPSPQGGEGGRRPGGGMELDFTPSRRLSADLPPLGGGIKPVLPFAKGQSPFEQLRERVAAAGKPLLIACFSQGSRERMQTLLGENDFSAAMLERWDNTPPPFGGRVADVSAEALAKAEGREGVMSNAEVALSRSTKDMQSACLSRATSPLKGEVYLAVVPLETGFETEKILILSEQDILGERITRAKKLKKKSDVFLLEAANFAEGELVVHKEHGIGRFEGLVTLTVTGAAHDCLKLIYEGGDKLFLPVENIEMVTRFGLDEEGAKLDKLGGASWQARKARLKEKILMSAEALLKTAAERTLKSGAVLEVEAGSYDDFCSRFPYMETEDQARAIGEVLEDLHKGRPMDRLICGDVGFGKTEVALRAAFVAVTHASPLGGEADQLGYSAGISLVDREGVKSTEENTPSRPSATLPPNGGGVQVALICPTTLLARQHYANFKKRFDGFPIEIRHLSRIVPARQQAETRDMLRDGKVDIVIGTHALLSKNVQFKNLGLLIVDEEQHFGVAQKEKLKELKTDIHVLTLSATPIPRTLQMALTGVRDLSLITTPPVDRLAIRSFVMPFDPVVVREAITREMHRGGKTFVVTPRIKHIGEVKQQLAEIVPEAKVVVAHGQMAASELDQVMNDFYDGKYDVLLATAIIESGLDIESANTMIIHNAHLLGLAQLYQLRGRVGRGKLRAYAYFLLPHYKNLTKNATRRLEVMQTLDTLGAGFTLASHDMDIRGFGNLVGEEQSGHIKEVGIELYQQMLEEAVASLKSAPSRPSATLPLEGEGSGIAAGGGDWSPQINLGLPVLIPEHYVDDLQLRLGLYRRAANMQSDDEINAFAAELVDRFGKLPPETETLIATLSLKLLCKQAGIERLDSGPKGAVITFRNNIFTNPEALLAHVYKNPRTLKVRPDQKLVFTYEWKPKEDVIAVLKKWISDIVSLSD